MQKFKATAPFLQAYDGFHRHKFPDSFSGKRSAMAKLTRLNPEQRENLIAYLDGELDDAQASEIEQALSESPVARHDVEMLSRTWDLLNVLPSAKATDQFSRRTLSSIHAAEESSGDVRWRVAARIARRCAALVLWTGALGLCAYVGFEATGRWTPQPYDQLLDEYEVIANYDAYSAVGDIEFLKTLESKRTFADYHDSDTH